MRMRSRHRAQEELDAKAWTGPTRRYDIVKEFVAALAVITLVTIGLAVIFGSPDRKAITLRDWAVNAPADFVATSVAELDGTSGTATYGAPYTHDPSAGQKLGPLPLQRIGGVREPIDTATDFVTGPLAPITDSAVGTALTQYSSASA